MAAVVELQGVRVERGGRAILRDVDWAVGPGERWVVLGGNGAGKTTLVQVAAGAVVPDAGRVTLLGEDLAEADLDELLPRLGWASVAVADQLPPRASALDVVMTAAYAAVRRGGEVYGLAEQARAWSLLARLGCRELVDRPFATLSEGERKRVQIARALMPDPELLVLDEPAAGLDLGGREALLRQLARLAADPAGPALVLVTHHVEEVPAGFTHALLLRDGGVLASGPVADVITAAALSECFGLDLALRRVADRWSAHARPLPPARPRSAVAR